MPALTRGPLPARVYWVRRILALAVAVLLVVGIARLLGGGSDGSSEPEGAAQVAADLEGSAAASPTTPSVTVPGTAGATPPVRGAKASRSPEPVLAEPSGS